MCQFKSPDLDRSGEQTAIELETQAVGVQEGPFPGCGKIQIVEFKRNAKQVVIEAFGVDDDTEIARDSGRGPFKDACAHERQMDSAEKHQRERNNRHNDD
jgi:hypothetical protein